MVHLEPLMKRNFLEYASYVIIDRAIPDLRDGLKPVQRRILHTLHEMDDGKFHKVANVIGETMKLHPHGDASIEDALVVLANKEYFIDKQGNFGNLLTGHRAAAARYIECRLTPLARATLFNPDLTETTSSYDGRRREPVFLPAKLPSLLLLGPEGIAVGMATRILPHNLGELLRAQIALLRNKPIQLAPDFLQGGVVDVAGYDDGRGKVKVRARLRPDGDKKIVIEEIPFSTTTESLIASIESAIQKGRLKVASIDDFTTDRVEIELTLPRGVYADEVVPQLYAYTDCEVSVSSNIVVIRDQRPTEMTVTEVLAALTEQLKQTLTAELEFELGELEQRRHWLTLEQIFIENRVYQRLETAKTEEKMRATVYEGMEKYSLFFVRPMVDDDVTRLLKIPIRRISAFDIERHRKDIDDIVKRIDAIGRKLKRMTRTTITYLEGLLDTYGEQFPRRSEIATFQTVDKKAVARQNIKLSYDPDSGFFGSQVKGSQHTMTVSEYDRILVVCKDGSYRVLSPPEKVLLPAKVLYCALFDPEAGAHFTVVYRDGSKHVFGKKIHILKFVRDREYQLIKGGRGSVDVLTQADDPGILHMKFVAAKRQRVTEAQFDLGELEPMGATARGKRLAPKPVARLKVVARG